MLRWSLILCVWALSLWAVNSQPVFCSGEEHCSEGHYCDTEAKMCRECLSCKDLQRETPSTSRTCIQSVAECGACLEGLVVDRLGDVNSACVVSGSEETGSSKVLIIVGAIVGILAVAGVGVIIFGCKVLKLGQGNCLSGTVNITTETRPSAPEAPPPYAPPQYTDIPYSSVRTDSPSPPHHENGNGRAYIEEEGPFIKPNLYARPANGRQTAGSQAANVYSLPIYERQDSSSPNSATVTELNDNLAIHEEDTMESPWTPTVPNGDINANSVSEASVGGAVVPAASAAAGPAGGGASLAAQVAAARDTALFEHTPPKQLCLRPHSTNRARDSNSGGDGAQGNFSGNQSGPPYFITQITNVVNINQ